MANNDPLDSTDDGPRPVTTPQAAVAAKLPPVDHRNPQIAETEALALFIARRGNVLGDDETRKNAYKELQDAIASAKAGEDESIRRLLDAYAQVSAFTYAEHGVNGRTILDTDSKGEFQADLNWRAADVSRVNTLFYRLQKPRNRPLLLGGTLLLMVGIFEGILLITGSKPAYTEINSMLLGAKKLLLPLIWGALGTCTFLMKKLSDRLSDFAFEEARARGMGTRVFLGAILGLIVVELTRDQLGTPPVFPIYLIAFLAGLGIKPVYAAIESLVEGLAARIKLPQQGGKT